VVILRIEGIERDGAPVFGGSLFPLDQIFESDGEIVVRAGVIGPRGEDGLEERDRFVRPLQSDENIAEVVESIRIVRSERRAVW